jgi:hypothetical protein
MRSMGSTDLDKQYALNTKRSELFGWLLLAGLVVELLFAVFSEKSWTEWGATLISDAMIVIGVWGEIHFGRKARVAGDAAQEEAKARVAEAELETEKLRSRFAWRRLELDRFEQLKADLRPDATVIGISTPTDPESATYADDIAAVLSSAGYEVRRQYSGMVPRYGVSISEEANASRAIFESLRRAGVELEIRRRDWPTPSWIDDMVVWPLTHPVIFVGLRPRPFISDEA